MKQRDENFCLVSIYCSTVAVAGFVAVFVAVIVIVDVIVAVFVAVIVPVFVILLEKLSMVV